MQRVHAWASDTGQLESTSVLPKDEAADGGGVGLARDEGLVVDAGEGANESTLLGAAAQGEVG